MLVTGIQMEAKPKYVSRTPLHLGSEEDDHENSALKILKKIHQNKFEKRGFGGLEPNR